MTVDQLVELIIAVCMNVPFGGPRISCMERMNNCAVGYGGKIMQPSQFQKTCVPLINDQIKSTNIKDVTDDSQ